MLQHCFSELRALCLTVLFVGQLLLILSSQVWAGTAKVDVCHVPPGNPENVHTITISEKALPAHLAHGDLAGSCDALCESLCDDQDPCTIDGCIPGTLECLDPADRPIVDCSDGVDCTDDSCVAGLGCLNERNDTKCAGDERCNSVDGCIPCPEGACCIQIREHCYLSSFVSQEVCGPGKQQITKVNTPDSISYITFSGADVTNVTLHHCVDGSGLSGATHEINFDTNLCDLQGGSSGDPRWNDEVCYVELHF